MTAENEQSPKKKKERIHTAVTTETIFNIILQPVICMPSTIFFGLIINLVNLC